MINKYLKLFGLKSDASLNDVKKSYRTFAKQNHPDRFIDDEQKKEQEKKMAEINEAYRYILANFNKVRDEIISDKFGNNITKPEKENDTVLYKKGVEYFNKYSGSISLKSPQYTKFDQETIEEKEANLKESRSYFMRVLQEYPESDWAYDSEERLKKIEKIMKNLVERQTSTKSQPLSRSIAQEGFERQPTLPRKGPEFYDNKFKNLYRK